MGHPDQSADSGRREAIKKMAVGAGAMTAFPILGQAGITPAMARAVAHLHAAQEASSGGQPVPDWKPLFFDQHQNESVVALTELTIPGRLRSSRASNMKATCHLWPDIKTKEFCIV